MSPRLVALMAALAASACGRLGFDTDPPSAPPDSGGVETREFRSLCAFDKVTVIKNGIDVDDSVGTTLQSALRTGCGNTPTLRFVLQDDPGILDPVTDRPLVDSSELAIIGGGEGPNRAIRYLLDGDTPIVWSGSSTATIRERRTNRLIAEGPITADHDFVMVMVIVEPIGGLHVLSAQGFISEGTIASGLWFARDVAPTIASNTAVWSLVDWTDSTGDGATANDAFVVVESGR